MHDYIAEIMKLPEDQGIIALELLHEISNEFSNPFYNQARMDALDYQLMSILREHDLV